jgi:pimeloyl-ACP methyl ester carboxylesterase
MTTPSSRTTGSSPPAGEIRHVVANGLRFAYLEDGPADGPLVLLVHGFPDTARTWDQVRPALAAAGYRAVSPWTRGYAPTEIPAAGAAFDGDTLGRDVLTLIDALGSGGGARPIVVGHDWGALAAFVAASTAPERLRMLVTLAIPHPAAVTPTPRLAWRGRHFLALRRRRAAAAILARDLAYVDELVHRWSPAWDVPAGETDAVKQAFREPGCLDAALAYYRALPLRLPASLRRKIEVPTASFAGDTDILPVAAHERARRRYLAPYEVVAMPGGHFLHREHPERFITELIRVLGTAPAA